MTGKRYNFDEVIERRNTGSLKWDALKERFGTEDLLPLWVADMDFRAPEPIIEALTERAKHGIYGYSTFLPPYFDSVINWYSRRYGWNLKREWIVNTPGVVPAINFTVQGFTSPGDRVIIQPPVYYPFFEAIESNGREVLHNPLKYVNGRYEMDFEDLEKKASDPRAKLMILCSPQNPVGRVWSKEELTRVGEICRANDVLVFADEIHSDLTYPGVEFTNFASISDELADISITGTSATKTFNLAGIKLSNIIIPNPEVRATFEKSVATMGRFMPNSFATTAIQTAYDRCEDWLIQLMDYLKENLEFMKGHLRENLPRVKVIEPEGTYLCWLDFRDIERDPKKLETLMQKDARVALDEGYIFSVGGDGFERINLASPRSMLKQALDQITEAVKKQYP